MVALVLHGGAGLDPTRDYEAELTDLGETAAHGRDLLAAGLPAMDVAVAVVRRLEAAGLYIAGRGASPNTEGQVELDAAVMDGATARMGGIVGLVGFRSAVQVARAVIDRTPHVLLAGDGAAAFARDLGCEPAEPDWFEPAGLGEVLCAPGTHGTVGCVALDSAGRLAVAGSTGGTFGKSPGRIGDTPLPGAGLWADERVAVACTGIGESFIKVAAAARLAHLVEFGGLCLREAAAATRDAVGRLAGAGGLIALDASGTAAVATLVSGLKCAIVRPDLAVSAHIVRADGRSVDHGSPLGDILIRLGRRS